VGESVKILFGSDETTQPREKKVLSEDTQRQFASLIADGKKGKSYTDKLGLKFPYCHPVSLYEELLGIDTIEDNTYVLDYFAGSGTTGHAILNLNRKSGNRKYILVEMGRYSDTITKPRLQKVTYSKDWKKGKPQSTDGTSHCFNYIKLEQYEDALNNIVFPDNADQPGVNTNSQVLDLSDASVFRYNLHSATETSRSLLTVSQFQTPTSYGMDIVELNERKPTNIDLLTTFNFLLGIKVRRIHSFTHQNRTYRVVTGIKGKQQFVIVWRNYDDALDLAVERDHIRQQEWYSEDARTYCNADNAFGAASTEDEFKRLMFEGTDG